MFIVAGENSWPLTLNDSPGSTQTTEESFVMASEAKFYSRSHKSPMFTVESTKNFMYQTVMRLCYKPGKIFPDTPWKAKLSFLFFRSHYLQQFSAALDNILPGPSCSKSG